MKKRVGRVLCLGLSALTACSLAACGGGGGNDPDGSRQYNTETRAVVLAAETPDGNFNPFFATSGPDTEILGMTQVGLLSTDKDGDIVYGEDEPAIALDYKKQTTGEGDAQKTEYKFIIKKGVKFSDGRDLTIKDVLFNLYVYLDTAYTGAATMYSTNIVGLGKYRTNNPNFNELTGDESESDSIYEADADERMDNLLAYLTGNTKYYGDVVYPELAVQDAERFNSYYKETITSDWTLCQDLEQYKYEYSFKETWEPYFVSYGLILLEKDTQGNLIKDGEGKYIMVEENYNRYKPLVDAVKTGSSAAENLELVKQFCINEVYEGSQGSNAAKGAALENSPTTYSNLWAYFKEAARNEANSTVLVPNIEGIKATKTSTDFKGNSLGSEHDVLTIQIYGVDPKAEYNFGFSVAPVHYYSGEYKDVDYSVVDVANNKFGVKRGDPDFFKEVLQDADKNARPMGAGAYQISNLDGEKGDSVGGDEFWENEWIYFTRNDKFETVGEGIENAKIKHLRYKIMTTDALMLALEKKEIDIGEPNATKDNITEIGTISHLNQKSVQTNGYGYVGINPKYVPDIEVRRAIMMAIQPGDTISEYYTNANASVLRRSLSLATKWVWDEWKNNPDYITQQTSDKLYYGKGENDYITVNKTPTSSYYGQGTDDQIMALVEAAGWRKSGGVYTKDGKKLEITFTIAGATNDHPAYNMFVNAKNQLEGCGFKINVVTDVNALKKLATGELAVWAAAWSSTIDPDMYQVYHIDSKASSTKNWGYEYMKEQAWVGYEDERTIITELSELIDMGRSTENRTRRAEYYYNALNLVMELAVELPTYQRNDCVAWNKDIIRESSLNLEDATAYAGVINKIWELDYN